MDFHPTIYIFYLLAISLVTSIAGERSDCVGFGRQVVGERGYVNIRPSKFKIHTGL